jgi:tRNA(Ile)-lysidine synthase
MYSRFLKYISDENLFSHHERLLLGVSGGVDSVVLAHLINRHNNEFAIAHCNFNLRGDESNDDELFVKELAESHGVKCYVESFSTLDYATEKGISIEMAARELRYRWFEKIRKENGFDKIVVAHHLDDLLETFILNLSRGTGIRGLSGIKPVAGFVVRPLLFATRIEIEAYAQENELDFRFDSSNDDIHIRRNKVRHQILPLLEEMNPSFRANLHRTIQNLSLTEKVYLDRIGEVKRQLVKTENTWTVIDKMRLLELQPVTVYLFEMLRDYGFNADTVGQIAEALVSTSGSQFFSSAYRLVNDREKLIITPIETINKELYYIERDQELVCDPFEMKITIETRLPGYKIPRESHIAVFDLDKINFPLVIRRWQQGEYFRPLGMTDFKKVSDFFIDEKLSIPEKENTWVIASDNKIIWIVGKRIDDRYKITSQTSQVLRMELIPHTL